jgi:DNA-binding MarR family transcriptional regulator/GNAT superfamily N-acetyltransferase
MQPAEQAERIRGFNRFYTRRIGLLGRRFLDTRFSLTEGRVLYELGSRASPRSTDLIRDLGLDPGYLSRLLTGFERQGLLRRTHSREDGRVTLLALTARGRAEFDRLNACSQAGAEALLAGVSGGARQRLVDSMAAIHSLLEPPPAPAPAVSIRTHRPGDIGWVVARHGELYAEEYGWDSTFEGLVATIAGDFLGRFDAERERCWIAERGDERVGCVFLVKKTKTLAKLRLLLVEPSARGLGIGGRLVDECIAFARQCGYRKLTLWTNDILHSARRIYQRAGFRLVKEQRHHSFGHDLVGQFWELGL